MKAMVFKDKNQVAVEEVENPHLTNPRDAILRVTSSAICGSDLHMYDGRTDMEKNSTFGHEIMGVIEEIGEAVTSIKAGDRVVLPFNISCGFCFNCVRGFTSACLTTNPDGVGAAYGYADMGPYKGGQAEFVRVPFADFNCLKLPGEPGDELENDFLMLADIFPTGYHACELANVQPGSTVAIFGGGPVGLLAAHSAFIRGASEVFVVDQSEERLGIASQIGAHPINFREGDPAEQIFEMRRNNRLIMDSFRPGEEKMIGVMCGIDAVGYQARSQKNPDAQEDPTSIIRQLVKVVNPTGSIGIVGVYMPQDPGGVDSQAKQGILGIPWGEIFHKGLTIGMGQTPVKKYNTYLRDLIIAGKAKPSIIVSHQINIEDVPEAYKKFDQRGMGSGQDYTKFVVKF
ncbi:glutathione-independent formaldehyde dehydrogenase [Candidatus Protochlamydia phocaeensis]|uniref:glutathione-independent formaldehyde dehydrogenase n=1 Tax=Candidatus Protochlamydia phocaeensis TaxID=1414722 RepID=UPI0008397513|nr:glutathione-independent formaldehyde dehydrogenase [Candidatus Protochlamydia phocaeensis]